MSVSKAHARVASESKKSRKAGTDPTQAPAVQDAKRILAEEKLKQHIQRTLDAAIPLTQTQKDALALLLMGGTS